MFVIFWYICSAFVTLLLQNFVTIKYIECLLYHFKEGLDFQFSLVWELYMKMQLFVAIQARSSSQATHS